MDGIFSPRREKSVPLGRIVSVDLDNQKYYPQNLFFCFYTVCSCTVE